VKKICQVCAIPIEAPATRCEKHKIIKSYTYKERKRRKAAVEEHIAAHGYWCPGWGVPAHPSEDLTADHVIPQRYGGVGGELRTLCRSCNSRRSTKLGNETLER
jgi:5-methylcytosine-specific restriction protein A